MTATKIRPPTAAAMMAILHPGDLLLGVGGGTTPGTWAGGAPVGVCAYGGWAPMGGPGGWGTGAGPGGGAGCCGGGVPLPPEAAADKPAPHAGQKVASSETCLPQLGHEAICAHLFLLFAKPAKGLPLSLQR